MPKRSKRDKIRRSSKSVEELGTEPSSAPFVKKGDDENVIQELEPSSKSTKLKDKSSPRKENQARNKEKPAPKFAENANSISSITENAQSSSKSSNQKEKSLSKKEKRKLMEEELRKRNKGVGLKISTSRGAPNSKKTTFESDEEIDEQDDLQAGQDDSSQESPKDTNVQEHDQDDDDDDSDVEEVGLQDAKRAMLAQQAAKEEEIRFASITKKRKRKAKSQSKEANTIEKQETLEGEAEEDVELSEDMLALLDANRTKERKIASKERESIKSGKLTTFVIPNTDANAMPKIVEEVPNMEVVVLDKERSPNQVLTVSKPSILAQRLARYANSESFIHNGYEKRRQNKFVSQFGRPSEGFFLRK